MKTSQFRIILAFFLFSSFLVDAQENVKANQDEFNERTGHNFGFAAGAEMGYGLSYRYFPRKFGIQITTAPFVSSDGMNLSIGATALYSLQRMKNTEFYLYYGNHYNRNVNKYEDFAGEVTEVNNTYITGVGAGIELVAWKKVGFNFMFGLGYYHFSSDDWMINVSGGVGIYYKL